jgi:hypothetical protein
MEYEIDQPDLPDRVDTTPISQPKRLDPVDFIPDSIDIVNQLNRIIGNTVSSTISGERAEPPKVEVLNAFKETPIVNIFISAEFAGMIFFATQLISRNILTQLQGANLIRQFYEFDTGKYLQPKEIKSLLFHEKVKQYETSIMANIEAKYKRRTLLEEAEREMMEKSKVAEVKKEQNETEVKVKEDPVEPEVKVKEDPISEPVEKPETVNLPDPL